MSRKTTVQKFVKDTKGSLTIWNTVSMVAVLTIGGFAVDTSNAWRVKTMLQSTAEASALAAAIHIEDPAKAKQVAVSFARKNMAPGQHGDVVRPSDVELGIIDAKTGNFIPTEVNAEAIRVTAGRDKARQNEVATYLLRIAGVRDWDVGRSAIAYPKWGGGTSDECTGAKVIGSGILNAGGDNTILDGSCFHGEIGLLSKGGEQGDFFDDTVVLTSRDFNGITIEKFRAGSAALERIGAARSKKLKLVPALKDRFDAVEQEIWISGGDRYDGDLLPSFLKDANGGINVVRVSQTSWTVGPSDLRENTIYLVDGSVKFSGPTKAQNTGIIAGGSIESTEDAKFQNVIFMAEGKIDFGGQTTWGDKTNYCDQKAYNSYVLSQQYVALGGTGGGGLFKSMVAETFDTFEGASSAHGLVAAAPILIPGAAFQDVGSVYVESSAPYATLGGNMQVTYACDEPLESHFETANLGLSEGYVIGSSLRRERAPAVE